MKIAAITLTRNDDFRLVPWKMYFQEYKDELYEHIVVDNGSTPEYQRKLREAFPDSTHIELGYNGGCTGAYNAGIRHALQDSEIDAIMLIGNDVKIERGGLTKLFVFLYSNNNYGMVGPVILKKDSTEVACFGMSFNPDTGIALPRYAHKPVTEIQERTIEGGYVPGGVCMAKPEFYGSIVGLQDEALFLYGDERDMAHRIYKAGVKEAVTSEVRAWHQHINDNCATNYIRFSSYLQGRNHVYLDKKHLTRRRAFAGLCKRILFKMLYLARYFYKYEARMNVSYYIKGTFAGLKGNMDNNIQF